MGRTETWLVLVLCLALGGLLYWFQLQEVEIRLEAELKAGRAYTLQFWDYPLPLVWEDGTAYQDRVKQIITDFESKYPNITIQYRPLSFLEGPSILEEALRCGSPPDVYSEPFSRGLVYHWGLQIPINGFLSPEEQALYHPQVLTCLEVGGEVWGWPSWVSPQVWAGNRQVLEASGLDVAQVQTLGWNWDELVETGLGLGKENSRVTLLTGPGELELFANLLLNSGVICISLGEGDRTGLQEALVGTANFLQLLRSEGLWQRPHSDYSSWLENFWTGRAALLGPVNTWVLRGADNHRQPLRPGIELVFLPPPHRVGEREYTDPVVAQVRVFRQQRFKGSDQVRAAMEFARYFSRYQGQEVAPRLWALPAYNPWAIIDCKENEMSPSNTRYLLRSQEYLRPLPADATLWQAEQRWKQEVLGPELEEFLADKITAWELADRVMQGLK